MKGKRNEKMFLYFSLFIYYQLFATSSLQKQDMGIFAPIITAVGLPRRKETRYVCPNLNSFHTRRDYRTRFLIILREMMGMKIYTCVMPLVR